MDQHRSPSVFRRPVLGLALLAAALLVLGLAALPADAPSGPVAEPAASYASLQDLLRDGRGKGLDRGSFEIWASVSPTPLLPTAWVWVVDDTVDGDGVEIWAWTADYGHPGADADARLTFHFRDDVDPASVQEFVDWIVLHNAHVGGAGELTVVKSVVSVVE